MSNALTSGAQRSQAALAPGAEDLEPLYSGWSVGQVGTDVADRLARVRRRHVADRLAQKVIKHARADPLAPGLTQKARHTIAWNRSSPEQKQGPSIGALSFPAKRIIL